MNNPPTAIIIATYNNAEYVLDAIKSALVQTYQPCSVMVTDDFSTDNSLKVIREYCGEECLLGENEHYRLSLFKQKRFPIYLFALKKNVGRGV